MAKRNRNAPPKLADWHLWTEVKRSIVPLRREPEPDLHEPPLPVPPKAPPAPRISLKPVPPPASQPAPPAPRKTPKKTIEPRLRRRLGRGQIELDGTLDLHGMRQVEAREALLRFVAARSARGDRTLLIITGKGLKKMGDAATIVERGVLRSMLPLWLAQPDLAPLVAGWDVAAPTHGGEGAVYLRLRQKR